MHWLMRIIAWRSNQPAAIRWLEVMGLYAVALGARLLVGRFYGGIPSLAFFPVLLVVAVLFGWKEALVVLVLSIAAGLYWFLPSDMYLMPVGWLLVGGFTIAIIGALRTVARQLADANERQRILFRELQHRVANTLQGTVGILDAASRKVGPDPAEAKRILEDGIRRIMASADVHRRLNDPTLFNDGLHSILRDSVATVIDVQSTTTTFSIEPVDLSFDQMSIITMLVIEFANNAQKHVFERDLGRHFAVSLKVLPDGHAALSAKDDGPGWSQTNTANTERNLGQTILQGLADQLGGTMNVVSESGSEFRVVFPLRA